MRADAKTIVVIAVAVAATTFSSVFAYHWIQSSVWPSEDLNWTSVEDGFYQMAWDSDDHLQVAFIGTSGPYYALNYGERVDRQWHITSISRLFYEHQGVSIDLDSQDNVYMCTFAPRGCDFTTLGPHILFATNSGGAWHVEIINTTGYCTGAGLAVDANDRVHIFYSNHTNSYDESRNTTLVHMELTSHGWENTTLKTMTGNRNSFWVTDIDGRPDGSIAILCTSLLNGTSFSEIGSYACLTYSVYSAGLQPETTIMDSSDGEWWGMSLCHDSSGRPYVSAERRTEDNWTLCYATNSGGDWALVDLAYGGNSAWSPRTWITLDHEGDIYIGYFLEHYDGVTANHTVRYMTNEDGQWRSHVVDDCEGWWVAESIALEVDESGDIHIVYFQRVTSSDHGDRDWTAYTTSQLDPDRFVDSLPTSCFSAILVCGISVLVTVLVIRTRNPDRIVKKDSEELGLYDDR